MSVAVKSVLGLPFWFLLVTFGAIQHGMIVCLTVNSAMFPFAWGLIAGPLIVVIVAQIGFWLLRQLGAVFFICWAFILVPGAVWGVVFQSAAV